MAELANRMELEADFARRLARVSSRHRRELIELMGNPPDARNVPEEFWKKVEEEEKAEVTSILLLLFMAAGEQHSALLLPDDLRAVAIDGLRDQGQAWAAARAGKLVGQYVEHSRKLLARLETRWYGSDIAVNRLFGEIMPLGSGQIQSGAIEIFGPERDAGIATTETTIAATAGTNGAIGSAGAFGIRTTVTWNTEDDGKECPFCGALHKQRMKDWESILIAIGAPVRVIDEVRENGGPTAHKGCRCWLEVKRETKVAESFDPSRHPRDADGRFSGGLSFVTHPYAGRTETTVFVDAAKLDAQWRESDPTSDRPTYYIPEGGGGAEIEGRRQKFEEFLSTGKPIEASRITFSRAGKLHFSDGRHRFSVLRDRGEKRVAVTVEKRYLPLVRKLLGGDS